MDKNMTALWTTRIANEANTRGALVYPVVNARPVKWRIRVERYDGAEAGVWFGGRVLWGHDKQTQEEAQDMALEWIDKGKLPEGFEWALKLAVNVP